MNEGDLARSLEALDQALEDRHRAGDGVGEQGWLSPEPDAVMRQLALNLQVFARIGCRISEDDHRRALERANRRS